MPGNGFGGRVLRARLEYAARLGRPVSQVEVGKALGVTGVAVGSWESGEKEPSLATIAELAAFLQVSPCRLAFGEEGQQGQAVPLNGPVPKPPVVLGPKVTQEERRTHAERSKRDRAVKRGRGGSQRRDKGA